MGTRSVNLRGEPNIFCAEGARAFFGSGETAFHFSKAMNDCLNYYRINEMEPGAKRWIGRKFDRMKRDVDKLFFELEGMHFDDCVWYCDGWLHEQWEDYRKHGYQYLRDHELLTTEPYPLFDSEDNHSPGATVYAYTAKIARYDFRVIKLGYTTSKVPAYLAAKAIAHDPKLLATTPGDKALEDKYKDKWRSFRAAGEEWFFATRDLVDWIKYTYSDIQPLFDDIANEAIREYGQYQCR